MSSREKRYRRKATAQNVIGFSVSYERSTLLARGLGLEHLREMLLRLARPFLRQGASLAYGGNWRPSEDNFTYDLLRLISAEQEDVNVASSDSVASIGRLYNFSAWPFYLDITPQIEAQWINCSRIIRVTQSDAGLRPRELVSDADASTKTDRVVFNSACTLSAMRQLMYQSRTIPVVDAAPETVPPISAQIMLGGKTQGFSGFAPGIFAEASACLDAGRPLYLLGGFGGATAVLTGALHSNATQPPPELTLDWQTNATPGLAHLIQLLGAFRCPDGIQEPAALFNSLWQKLLEARNSPSSAFHTGLDDETTMQLMTTSDMQTAIRLVREGIAATFQWPQLPA